MAAYLMTLRLDAEDDEQAQHMARLGYRLTQLVIEEDLGYPDAVHYVDLQPAATV